MTEGNDVRGGMDQLVGYVAGAVDNPVPDTVTEAALHHILDTVAAIVSGSTLSAGKAGRRYVEMHGADQESTVLGSGLQTSAINAALANGMSGHADETDDSHQPSMTHPGCSIVPAALAVAERNGSSGLAMIRAVIAGYDIDGRITRAIWPDWFELRSQLRSSHSIGGLFGSTAAVGALSGLDSLQLRHLFSYACQQASGLQTSMRELDHVEKAFSMGGMPATNAVRGLGLIEAGWTGVDDALFTSPSFFDTFASETDPTLLVEALGSRFVVTETNIKRYAVGSPGQAALQALFGLIEANDVEVSAIERVVVRLPEETARAVTGRHMPDLNVDYLVSVVLEDGALSFEAAHDRLRFDGWSEGRDDRVLVVGDAELSPAVRQAVVELSIGDGRELRWHETAVRGTAANPMRTDEVVAKAKELCVPVLGERTTQGLIDGILSLTEIGNIQELRPWFGA